MRLYLSTKNQHKVIEISSILSDTEILTFDNLPDIEETGTTFQENADIKSKYLSTLVPDEYVIADDSGIVCEALNGKPGVFSARYAHENATDNDNIIQLLYDMKDIANREAYFICNISLAKNGVIIANFEGILNGTISYDIIGEHGFGYDPIFMLSDGHTLAEYSSEEKNNISHRRTALYKLKKFITDNI